MKSGVALLIIALNFFYAQAVHYDNQDQWGGICTTGTRQSPIDLSRSVSQSSAFPNLVFDSNQTYDVTLEIGHDVRLVPEPGSAPFTVYGGPLQNTYILDNVHFHSSSEHALNGHRYYLESHMVFYSSNFANLDAALGHSEGVTVFGTFYDMSSTDNPNLQNFIDTIPNSGASISIKFVNFLPNNIHRFFTYEGSLTTPNCTEGVRWIVFKKPIPLSETQIGKFHVMGNNARNLQNLNGRTVYRSC